MKWFLSVVSICISLVTGDAEHLLVCAGRLFIFSGDMSAQALDQFLTGLLEWSSLHILDKTQPRPRAYFLRWLLWSFTCRAEELRGLCGPQSRISTWLYGTRLPTSP